MGKRGSSQRREIDSRSKRPVSKVGRMTGPKHSQASQFFRIHAMQALRRIARRGRMRPRNLELSHARVQIRNPPAAAISPLSPVLANLSSLSNRAVNSGEGFRMWLHSKRRLLVPKGKTSKGA